MGGYVRYIVPLEEAISFLNRKHLGCNSVKELEKFDFNDKLYQKNSDFEAFKFKTGLLGLGSIYDCFIKAFINTKEPEGITNKNEKLIKRVYDTLCNLYNFKN